MATRDFILGRIERFMAENSMSEYRFGVEAIGDPKLVSRLRDPKVGVTLRTIEAAERFMDDFGTGEAATSDAA